MRCENLLVKARSSHSVLFEGVCLLSPTTLVPLPVTQEARVCLGAYLAFILDSLPPLSCPPPRVLATASGVLRDRRFLKSSTVALVALWLSYAVWGEATLCVPDFGHSTDSVPGPPIPHPG